MVVLPQPTLEAGTVRIKIDVPSGSAIAEASRRDARWPEDRVSSWEPRPSRFPSGCAGEGEVAASKPS